MKRMILAAMALFAFAFVSAPAQAQAQDLQLEFKPYVGFGMGTMAIKMTGIHKGTGVTHSYALNNQSYMFAIMGAEIHRYFAIEMRDGFTKYDASAAPNYSSGSYVALTSLDYVVSLFAKPKVDITPSTEIYGLLGGTRARIAGPGVATVTNNMQFGRKTLSGFSFGGGVEYKASKHFHIGAEVVSYLNRVNATPPSPNKVSLYSYALTMRYGF